MNKSKELAIVQKLTHITDENRIVLNETGWTSRVYIIDDGAFVFKFPRGKKWYDECRHELTILKLISEYAFNVNLPLIKWEGENLSYTGFYGVKGKSITTQAIEKLNDRQKREVGEKIGLFLKKLHSIDYKGKSPNNESDIILWLQKTFHKRKRLLEVYFNKNELETIEEIVTAFPQKSTQYGTEQVFCHCDLGYNNILLTGNLEVGIIDFGDSGMYEKSHDFTGLEDDIMLDAAIIAYGDDEVLREKVAIRRQLLPLMEMLFLIDRKDEKGINESASKIKKIIYNNRR
ncbi:MAG: aminoglycoside phosphotransferase family protein [Tannerella sp.]|jgi:thiamine kinase-like enzyme|nr:aminoglycoside phosphotransferase family protein [Tannerella sp.]